MGWFDNPKNSTGALTTRLANDASQVKGVSKILGWKSSYLVLHVMKLQLGFDRLDNNLDFDN